MRKKNNWFHQIFGFASLLTLVVMASCNKEPGYTPPSWKSAVIFDFWLEQTGNNAAINRPYQGMIVGDTAIRLTVDYGTDISALEPTIFADADSISPTGKQNFFQSCSVHTVGKW